MVSWFRSQAKLIQQQYILNLCYYTTYTLREVLLYRLLS